MLPWEFQRIYVQPGRKIYGLLIIHDPSYKIGEELTDILYGSGAFLVSILSTSREEGEEDLVTIDLTDSTASLKELKERKR